MKNINAENYYLTQLKTEYDITLRKGKFFTTKIFVVDGQHLNFIVVKDIEIEISIAKSKNSETE